MNGGPTNPPAEHHADLNLALRGYAPTDAYKGLVDYSGGGDPNAPQLPGLFADNRTATFSSVYQVYDWDWERKRRGALVTNPEVTLAGLAVPPARPSTRLILATKSVAATKCWCCVLAPNASPSSTPQTTT